jgi:WD40 repeat protein
MRHQGPIAAVNFNSSSDRVVTGGEDGLVRLWDLSGSPLVTFPHRHQVLSVRFSPDGRRVLTSGYPPDDCQLWSPRLGRRIGSRLVHTDIIHEAAISPDGRTAALAAYDGWVVLWPLPEPDERDVERIVGEVNVSLMMELDDVGGRRVLDVASWRKLCDWLRRNGAL